MKTLKAHIVLVSLAAMGCGALAASPASSASGVAPDGYATKAKSVGTRKADAKAEENERLAACRTMQGDERKSCEAHARSLAAKSGNPSPKP